MIRVVPKRSRFGFLLTVSAVAWSCWLSPLTVDALVLRHSNNDCAYRISRTRSSQHAPCYDGTLLSSLSSSSSLLRRFGVRNSDNNVDDFEGEDSSEDQKKNSKEWSSALNKPYSSIVSSSSSASMSRPVRLLPRRVNGDQQQQVFELQTAVISLERVVNDDDDKNHASRDHHQKRQRVDVHAQVHFGSQDYFEYFNSLSFAQHNYDAVHYELLVDDSLLAIEINHDDDENKQGGIVLRYLPLQQKNQLMASPADQQMARQYGLSCQVQVVDYTQPRWIHSDLTRQELLSAISSSTGSTSTSNTSPWDVQQQQPLWALASTAPTWPGVEAAVALLRPLTPTTSLSLQTPVARRLFSNLFLPGTTLTAWFRALFWLTLPCPELNVLLLDWSSLWPPPSGTVSPIALPVLECLLAGQIPSARRLMLAQMLVSSSSTLPSSSSTMSNQQEPLLIGRRNDHAWNVISQSLNDAEHVQSVAILYGSSHIPDLTKRLMQLGFVPTQTKWRTAWSVTVPSNMGGDTTTSATWPSLTAPLAVGLIVLPIYFGIGGWDWISTLQQVAQELELSHVVDAGVEIVLYLLRHALLYLSLAKFVVAWDTSLSSSSSGNSETE